MYATVGVPIGFPSVEKWLVTLHLPHQSVRLGHVERNAEGKYECHTDKALSHSVHSTLIDAAYRIVWVMADNHVYIYFSHAVVKWCMEHDDVEESSYKGITNV